MIKKYLPFMLLALGVLFVVAVYLLVFRKSQTEVSNSDDNQAVPEVALSDRPVASLSPSTDGHWLRLNVSKIKISAETMDYELIYNLPDGRQQGVPGTVKLTGITSVERDLLLGSESSGKYRYDEGVSTGTLTLRFRNSQGKLSARFSTDFHLQTNTQTLTSADEKFSYKLDKNSGKEFLVTMQTFGYPGEAPGAVSGNPYGVFKATANIKTAKGILPITSKIFPGTVSLSGNALYMAQEGGWRKLTDGKSPDASIFLATSE